MSVDNCIHSLFGVSKTSSDFLVQEYGKNIGINTITFRAGCITGANHSSAEYHGFLSYLVKKTLRDKSYKVIGYKGLHLDDTLQIFASIYTYDYDGYQDELEQFDPIRGAGANFVSNADGITNKGFEIELYYAATDRLTLSGNFSYTETEYGEDYFVFMVDDPVNPVPVFGQCTQGYISCEVDNPDFAKDYTVNLKGGPLKGIPEIKHTVRATYESDSRFGPLWWVLSHSYTGEFSASGIQRPLDEIDSRDTTNLSVTWYSEDGTTSARAYIDNLMDNKNYYSLGTGDHETNYNRTLGALEPRTMGVDIRYRF